MKHKDFLERAQVQFDSIQILEENTLVCKRSFLTDYRTVGSFVSQLVNFSLITILDKLINLYNKNHITLTSAFSNKRSFRQISVTKS